MLATTRALVARAPFECGVLVLAVVYIALHLSPSSYALALDQLGEDASPLVGTARVIRTDEWAVMTPLFEATVNNDFRETNNTSFYRERLRNFIGLPVLNWGLAFKPLVWAFLILPPELAYSIFWAANAALMLIGWSILLRVLGFRPTTAAFASTILYFSPFVQAWTGPGPQLALFPWIVLALVRIRSNALLAVTLSALVPVWCLSMFYPPALPPMFLLALALCLAFCRAVFSPRRLVAAVTGVAVGAAVTYAYFEPVFGAYADSVYPGSRWVSGGGLPGWQVVSQLLPGTTTELYTNLVGANICEAATVATWLPLLALCVVDSRDVRRRYRSEPDLRRDLNRIGVLVLAWSLITLWQLVPLSPLSYALGLGLSPEERTLFASGALLLIAAAYAVDRLPVRITLSRLGAFTGIVLIAWLLASWDLQPTNELAARDELLVLVLVAGITPFALRSTDPSAHASRVATYLMALLPLIMIWGLFNPLQSTRVMFRKPDTVITRELDALAATRSDGAIAVPGFVGTVLNGAGYRSVTHVMTVPSPSLFRTYFPDMDEKSFNRVFNRYAHVALTTSSEPWVEQRDLIRIPIETMAQHAAVPADQWSRNRASSQG